MITEAMINGLTSLTPGIEKNFFKRPVNSSKKMTKIAEQNTNSAKVNNIVSSPPFRP